MIRSCSALFLSPCKHWLSEGGCLPGKGWEPRQLPGFRARGGAEQYTTKCESNQNHFGLYKTPHSLNKIWSQLFYLLFKVLNNSGLAKQQMQQNSCPTRQQLSQRSNCNLCFNSQAWNSGWFHNLEFRASEGYSETYPLFTILRKRHEYVWQLWIFEFQCQIVSQISTRHLPLV